VSYRTEGVLLIDYYVKNKFMFTCTQKEFLT